jgi:uncharacterized protein
LPDSEVRVLLVPGLHGSGPAHWQTWLQAHHPRSVRVLQHDWSRPDLERWSVAIEQAVASDREAAWVGVAHSFGCLALAQCIARQQTQGPYDAAADGGVAAALLVAPADPARFRLGDLRAALPQRRLGVPSVMLASETDPWMAPAMAAQWARTWGAELLSLGDAGHVNVDAGFGPLPSAKLLTEQLIRRVERARRIAHASVHELSFAI